MPNARTHRYSLKRAQPSRKGAGAERSGRWEGRLERGRRPQAAGRAQPPLRPAAERSGSTLLFRSKLPPVPSTQRNPEAHICHGLPAGRGRGGSAPASCNSLSLPTSALLVFLNHLLFSLLLLLLLFLRLLLSSSACPPLLLLYFSPPPPRLRPLPWDGGRELEVMVAFQLPKRI